MNCKFYLKDTKAKETRIYAQVTYNNQRVRYYLDMKIAPDKWNPKTGLPRPGAAAKDTLRLKQISDTIKDKFDAYEGEHGAPPAPEVLTKLLDIAIKDDEQDAPGTFFQFFEDIINKMERGQLKLKNPTRPYAETTIQVYRQTLLHLRSFVSETNRDITFDTIDHDLHEQLVAYLQGPRKLVIRGREREVKPMMVNAVGKIIKTFKAVLTMAFERDVTTNTAFKKKSFFTPGSEESDSIALTEEEVREMAAMELPAHLSVARDMFIVGCRTALRYSDLSRLTAKHIVGDVIEITMQKDPKKTALKLPIHPDVRRILPIYPDGFGLSNPELNTHLKAIAEKMPSLEGRAHLVTAHTARRTCTTNLLRDGLDHLTVMRITGHRKVQTLKRYDKREAAEVAKRVQQLWDSK